MQNIIRPSFGRSAPPEATVNATSAAPPLRVQSVIFAPEKLSNLERMRLMPDIVSALSQCDEFQAMLLLLNGDSIYSSEFAPVRGALSHWKKARQDKVRLVVRVCREEATFDCIMFNACRLDKDTGKLSLYIPGWVKFTKTECGFSALTIINPYDAYLMMVNEAGITWRDQDHPIVDDIDGSKEASRLEVLDWLAGLVADPSIFNVSKILKDKSIWPR